MTNLATMCYCVSLEKWKQYSHKDVALVLEKFQETECPNRPNIQKNYISALLQLENAVRLKVNALEHLDCSPLKISRMTEDNLEERTFILWWLIEKNITSKKLQVCGEDVEFQGGRKVQQHYLRECDRVIEYHCSTPKKGTAPWSRSIVKLQGSPLWVVNYRPRRVRTSNSPDGMNKKRISKLGSTVPLLSPKKRQKFPERHSPNILDVSTPPGSQSSGQWRLPVVRCASENSVNNYSPQWSLRSSGEESSHSNDFFQSDELLDTDPAAYPSGQEPAPVYRMVERTFSDPNKSASPCLSSPTCNYPYIRAHNFSPPREVSSQTLTRREQTIIFFIDKLLNPHNELGAVSKEASRILDPNTFQQFNSIIRLLIAPPLRNQRLCLSKQSRFLLYVTGCINSMGSSQDAITFFDHMYSVIYPPQDRSPQHHNGLWHRPFGFVKQQVVIRGLRSTRFVYVSPETNELSQLLRIRSGDTHFVGKSDYDLFEENFALQYLEEDFNVIDTNSIGIVFDNPLPLPCIYRCTCCQGVASKIHIPMREGSFIFACSTLVQCSNPAIGFGNR